MESGDFGGPWEDLKRTLCDELTPEEYREVLFSLNREKLGTEFSTLWNNDNPMDLFTHLENSMTECEALEMLKHVFAISGFHPLFSNKSVAEIIEAYENKTKEFESRFKMYRDVHFVGRQNEMSTIKKQLTEGNKGVWVSGFGGMGKTTLATEVCYRLNLYHYVNVVNVNLKGKDTSSDLMRAILMTRNENSSSTDIPTLSSQAITSIGKISTDTVLLLDSIEDCLQNDTINVCDFLLNLLDSLPPCVRVLVTSRLKVSEVHCLQQGLFEEVLLPPLSEQDAIKLLRISSRPGYINLCIRLVRFHLVRQIPDVYVSACVLVDVDTMESGDFGGPWEDLKRTLCDELTPEEYREVLFSLNREKLGTEFSTLWNNDNPMDLFTHLENSMTECEALEMLKHVFAISGFHPLFSNKSVAEIIEAYENKTKEFESRFKMYRDVHFVGRQNEMSTIKKQLTEGNKGVWVSGFGGMGKTTLATEVCYRLNLYHYVNVVNVNLKGKDTSSDLMRAILMTRNENSSSTDIPTLSSQAITSIGKINTDTVLLLDSIEDCLQNDTINVCDFLLNLLDSLPPCVRVLVTSRLKVSEVHCLQQGLFEEVLLPPLSEQDAIKLLRISSRPRVLSDDDCSTLLSFSGFVPLPIRILSRTLQDFSKVNVELPLEDILRSVERRGSLNPVMEVIQYSFDRLDVKHQQILQRLSVFENSLFETDEVMFITQQKKDDVIWSLLYLKYKSLVELDNVGLNQGGKNRNHLIYYLHPLVLSFLNKQKEQMLMEQIPCENHIDAERKFVELMLKKVASVEETHNERFVKAFSIFRDRTAHIKMLFKHLQNQATPFSIMQSSYLYKLAVFIGSPESREKMLKAVAKTNRKAGNTTMGLYWATVTAATCIDDDKFDKGEQYLKKIEAIMETLDPSTDTSMAYVQGEYFLTKGRINNKKGRFCEAEENFRKAHTLYLLSGDVKSRFSEVARVQNALGNVYHKLRNNKECLKFHQMACDIMKQNLFDQNNQDLTVYIFNLGTVKAQLAELKRESERDEANQLYEEALAHFNASMDIDNKLNIQHLPNYPIKLLQRSALHHRMGHYEESIADGREAIKLREEIYKENHSLITEAYFRLADLFFKRSRNDKEGTREERRECLMEAYRLCIEIEKQIRRGSYRNQNSEDILCLYAEIATNLRKKTVKSDVDAFCNDVRSGRLFADSSEESSGSTPSSSSPLASSDDEMTTGRHDSGLADSVSTQEDTDMSLQGMSLRQVSTESDVFMEEEKGYPPNNRCHETERQSSGSQHPMHKAHKRPHSPDSD